MSKIVELEKQLMQRNKELDVVRVSVWAAATQMGIGSSCRLVRCGTCSFQRNVLMQYIYCNHFKGDTQKYTYGMCTHVCEIKTSSFSTSRLQILGATVASHLGKGELIL